MNSPSLERHAERFLAALGFPLTTWTRLVLCVGGAMISYVLLVLSSFPEYSVQMVSANIGYLDDAIVELTANSYATAGPVGLGLIVSYAMLTGIAITNVANRVKRVGVAESGGLSSAVPGFLAAGCASCGAGILGFLGFAGALALLPFHGNLLRVGGLLLLVGYLARVGDPRYCTVVPDSGVEQ
ncbi:hypothetical protein C474_07692 [Halogeometricum pallidum JCM 14848]|uniref:Uncharacterized protein n=2 Tax=Halogeometricum TaxID=60846 RepID=M0DD23_HALPD|nr:hypothetical protein C474_07692 [Halogeometricum pallidum JCM 14848]